jgi:carbon monoxide dehydrogenase subunit G
VGPAVAQFAGTVDVKELDPTLKRMVMFGKGADKSGSSASMNMTVTIVPDPSEPTHCVLSGQAEVIVNGKFAQFGGRLMVQVSDMLLAQFVENFRQQAKALPGAEAAPQAGDAAKTTSQPEPAKVASEINGLSIVWSLIKNWISGMFGKRS